MNECEAVKETYFLGCRWDQHAVRCHNGWQGIVISAKTLAHQLGRVASVVDRYGPSDLWPTATETYAVVISPYGERAEHGMVRWCVQGRLLATRRRSSVCKSSLRRPDADC